MTTIDRAAFLGTALAAAGTGVAQAQTDTFGKPHAPIVPENDPAIVVMRPRLQRPDVLLSSYAALPKNVTATTPGVVMTAHIWGVDPQYQDMARRLAKAGFIAIVPNIFERTGVEAAGLGESNIAPYAAAAKQMYAAGLQYGDLRAGRDWIKTQASAGKVGIYGNCMGGGIALQALVDNTTYAAASVLYGYVRADRDISQPAPPGAFAWATKVKAAVLGSYAGADQGIATADVEAAFALLAGPHDLKIYPDAPHAFLDDTRSSYRPGPAADAWARQLAWFGKYLTA
jgi:carboxymethylenebutenolidase